MIILIMKKSFSNWVAIAFVLMLCIGLPSCSKDGDKEKEDTTSIVGTWRHDFSTGYILLVLRSNGSGLLEESDSGEIDYSHEISYYYDKEQGRYMIVENNGSKTYTYPIQYYNETTLVLINPDGKSETYTRVAN